MAIGVIRNVGTESFFPNGWKLMTGELAAMQGTFTANYKIVNGIWRQGGTFEFINDIIPLAISFNGVTNCPSSSYQTIMSFNALYNDLNNVAKTDVLLYSQHDSYRALTVNETRLDLMFKYGMNFDLLQKIKKFEVIGGGGAGSFWYSFKVTAWLERA